MNANEVLEKLAKYNLEGFSHTDEGLTSHLKGTYEILKKWDCSEDLCLAGLCHSIYGTDSYRNNPIDLSERDQIKSVIGENAEKLVYFFGAHVKDTLWLNLEKDNAFSFVDILEEKEINISKEELSDLITLTLANWLEQRPRVPEKYLYIRQEEFKKSKDYLPEVAFQEFLNAYGIVDE